MSKPEWLKQQEFKRNREKQWPRCIDCKWHDPEPCGKTKWRGDEIIPTFKCTSGFCSYPHTEYTIACRKFTLGK